MHDRGRCISTKAQLMLTRATSMINVKVVMDGGTLTCKDTVLELDRRGAFGKAYLDLLGTRRSSPRTASLAAS